MSASSESLAAVLDRLEPTVGNASLPLARELFSMAGVLASSAGLRRSLTEPSRSAQEKGALIQNLFGSKATPDAQAILALLAQQRWNDPSDLVDAMERAARLMAVATAENAGKLETLNQEVLAARNAVQSNSDLGQAFSSGTASPAAREKLAYRLLGDYSDEGMTLLSSALLGLRGRRPAAVMDQVAREVSQRQRRWIADVTSPVELTQRQRTRLVEGLSRSFGRQLQLNLSVDPTLVGGLRIAVGDEIVDGTIDNRLGDLRQKMAN